MRNHFGNVLGIATRSFDGIQSPRVAKSLAILEGLNLALDLKLERVVTESDAEATVRCLTRLKLLQLMLLC